MELTTVARQLLFTTVQVECTHANSGTSFGTAFLFSHPAKQGIFQCLVTNKHVIAGAVGGTLTFTQARNDMPDIGNGFSLNFTDGFEQRWTGHPDPAVDVAILPFLPLIEEIRKARGVELFVKYIDSQLIPSPEQMQLFDAIEQVIFIGYPSGLWDKRNLIPIVRQGITASPIALDFNGEKKFLVDASVFPGSSGSPVLIYSSGIYRREGNTYTVGERLYFVGILAAVFEGYPKVRDVQSISHTISKRQVVVTNEVLDLGIVYKAETIAETIGHFLKSAGIS